MIAGLGLLWGKMPKWLQYTIELALIAAALWFVYHHQIKAAQEAQRAADHAQIEQANADRDKAVTAYEQTKQAYDDAQALNAQMAANRASEAAKLASLTRSLNKATEAITHAPDASSPYTYSDGLYGLMQSQAADQSSAAETDTDVGAK